MMNQEAKNTFIDVEKELVNVITELGYLKGRSDKFSIISAYMYVRGELTQSILKNLTGFSLSTISNILNKLEENKTIEKEFNKSSRQYYYKLKGTLGEILGRNMGDIQTYFTEINRKMQELGEKLKDSSLFNKKGYEHLKDFVDKMKILIPAFQNLMKKYQIPSPKVKNGDD